MEVMNGGVALELLLLPVSLNERPAGGLLINGTPVCSGPQVLAAGAIPVILADDWVLPFSGLVDWDSIAVRIPEKSWNDTLRILR